MDWELGLCWACVVGTLVYDAACDWYQCTNCGYVGEPAESLVQRWPAGARP